MHYHGSRLNSNISVTAASLEDYHIIMKDRQTGTGGTDWSWCMCVTNRNVSVCTL